MTFDDEVVEVGGFLGVKGRKTKVVEDDAIYANELLQLLVVTGVEAPRRYHYYFLSSLYD